MFVFRIVTIVWIHSTVPEMVCKNYFLVFLK